MEREVYVGKNFIIIGNTSKIRKEENGFYAYDRGWISPSLDIIGAWSLAKGVGVTLEQFEKAFGELLKEKEETREDFVRRFFINGMLPVQINAKPCQTLWTEAVDNFSNEEIENGKEERVIENIPNLEDYSLKEIFERIIKPTYSEYTDIIKFEGDIVRYNVLEFIKLNENLSSELYYNMLEFIREEALKGQEIR